MGTVAKALQEAQPESKTLCFEPWPGNKVFFDQIVGKDTSVELIQKAVADFNGKGSFYVPSMVEGNEKDWGHRRGYSSTGMLVPNKSLSESEGNISQDLSQIFEKTSLDDLSVKIRNSGKFVGTVDVTSIDFESKENIRFLKIDVQGGEGAVLRGAQKTVNKYGIDIMYVEYQGEEDVGEFLEKNNYVIFDTAYNAIPVTCDVSELPFRKGSTIINLSNGSSAVRGRLDNIPRTLSELPKYYADFRENFGYLWTDLVCVHESVISEFEKAINKLY